MTEKKVQQPIENRRKKKSKKGRRAVGLLLVTLLVAVGLFFMLRVIPKTAYRTVELGTSVSHAPENYLEGLPFAVKLGQVDTSEVNGNETGNYTIHVRYLLWDYPFSIEIVDTTPPEIIPKEGNIWVGVGRSYNADFFLKEAGDNSNQLEVLINGSDSFQSETAGTQNVTIEATDPSGNRTEKSVTVMSENPPVITGIKDYYVTPDAEPAYEEDVVAQDAEDGDLTAELGVDSGQVNQSQDGTYQVVYSVTDSNGISTEEAAQVTVCSAQELEQLVGNRSVDVAADRVRGIPNYRDAGEGSASNMEEESRYLAPTLVYLKILGGNLRGNGSGFILNMTDEYVDICSNHHVLQYPQDYYSVVFAGGGQASRLQILGTDEENDLGFARVRRKNIPKETWNQLMSVHLNQTMWDNIVDDGRELLMICLNEQGEVSIMQQGKLLAWNGSAAPYHDPQVMEFDVNIAPGNSGSPIFDVRGNLTSVVFGHIIYSTGEKRRFGIQFDEVVRLYQQMSGNQLYTY